MNINKEIRKHDQNLQQFWKEKISVDDIFLSKRGKDTVTLFGDPGQ